VTSTTGTDEHPEVAEISALTEGVLSPGRSADVRGHLNGCELCADVRASLEEIRGLLGTLPGPPQMPADVAGRIDAALAAEALLTSTEQDTAVSRETADPERASEVSRETSVTRDVGPQAGLDVGPQAGSPAGHAPGSNGPGRERRGRRRWRKGLLISVSAAAVLGLGGILVSSLQPGGEDGRSQARHSAGNAATDAVRARVTALLAQSPPSSPNASPEKQGDSPADRPMLGTAAATPSCVRDGIGRAEQPLASEPYKYQGTASYLVVLAHPSDASRVDAYVVDASCSSASPTRPGKVLLSETYTR
jgi:hypothetical protein